MARRIAVLFVFALMLASYQNCSLNSSSPRPGEAAKSYASTTVSLGLGGACPAGVPITGNNCFFVAANGSDSNSGLDENHPLLHAPGMPACSGNCLNIQNSFGGDRNNIGGVGIILRGGDTWHFGNSGLSPYTGGTWKWTWDGDAGTCTFTSQAGCNYLGVDNAWYNSTTCGSSWCRPKLNGDNPLSKSYVSQCSFQTPSIDGSVFNSLVWINAAENAEVFFDNFEMLGFCGQTAVGNIGFDNDYIHITDNDIPQDPNRLFVHNVYIHGWTTTSTIQTDWTLCEALGGDVNTLQDISGLVIDGSDSIAADCTWGSYPSLYHFKDSYISNIAQGVGQNCHDIHDIVFDNIVGPAAGGHQNIMECNADYSGGWLGEPAQTVNAFYNIIVRHSNTNVDLWYCPNTVPEYHFDNIMYDTSGEGWAFAGSIQYPNCTWTGGVNFFNNTLAAGGSDTGGTWGTWSAPGATAGSDSPSQAQYFNAYNNLLLDTDWYTGGTLFNGGPNSTTNVSLTRDQAIAQGYLSSSPGEFKADTCANDSRPCAPTSATNSSVGAGANFGADCSAITAVTDEPQIGVTAASACMHGTTDGCGYDMTTHTMICPAYNAPARPSTGAWDSGADQFSGVVSSPTPTPSPSPTMTSSSSPSPMTSPTPVPSPADTTPPSTTITSPADGQLVMRRSTVTIQATASDDVGVTAVKFLVNGTVVCTDTGANVGGSLATQYSCNWKVPGAPNKTYQIQTQAFDASGNVGSSGIVTVST